MVLELFAEVLRPYRVEGDEGVRSLRTHIYETVESQQCLY